MLSNLRDPLTAQTTTVTDHVTGLRYLQKHEFLPIGILPTPACLTTALFQVTQLPHVPASAVDGIRAVAFLLEKVEVNSLVSELQKALPPTISETVANHVIASILPHIASLQDAASKLSTPDRTSTDNTHNPPQAASSQADHELTPQITSIHESVNQFQEKLSILNAIHQHLAITNTTIETEALAATVDWLENLVETVNFNLNDTSNAINVLAPSLEATQFQINSLHKHLTVPPLAQPEQPQPQSSRLYSDAVKNTTVAPRAAIKAMAKAETRSRQVLFTPHPNQSLYSKNTDPAAIVADIADQLIRIQDAEDPYVNIKSAICLNNRNLLLELNSTEAANWMRNDPVRQDLARSLGIEAVVKEQMFPIVIPFFPVTHDLTDPAFLRTIEHENDLPNDSIHSIRWVKNPEHRRPGQCVAHAILLTRNTALANHLLRNRMYAHHTKLFPKKDKKEPIRCAKCQLWGHIARDCITVQDVCSSCGGPHRFTSCDHPQRKYCASCKTNDHPSSSRDCREFIRCCAALDAKHPDNSLPYFPTPETWTQSLLPFDHTPAPPPPTPPSTPTLPTPEMDAQAPASSCQPQAQPPSHQRKQRQLTVLSTKSRQATLDSYAKGTKTTTIIRSSTSTLPEDVLNYTSPFDANAFSDPPTLPPAHLPEHPNSSPTTQPDPTSLNGPPTSASHPAHPPHD
ncbi:hypothetical protein F5141DRAFT_1264222 [Pisolithus sp. B1]|nr:hypothetical protein F5141DRAFT_1264222 [Pisolithus sp. B1]